ncbi:MAG: AAA family ATPase [Coriobacteriia bacterium]|nr:AAA family ATPase [Coriobacteriia bacterium]
MRLRRAEAVSYGALADATLGELGDGLTVVHGPNEAGKSTFISLVRHVLYGFPTLREKEAGYAVPGGKRVGRLVFEDESGSWVIERTEGVRGGDVKIRAISGSARPDLAASLVRGVSAHAYRVVFGFGLDEMPVIEEGRGSSDDIIARLYAASAGLTVSPHQVRATVESEMEALFKPTGRKPAINALALELKGVRAQSRELCALSDSFSTDRERVRELARALAEAREVREAARAKATALAVATERADERMRTIAVQEEALIELRREAKRLADEIETIDPDDALVTAAPELDAVLAEAAGFGQSASALADDEAVAARAATRAADAATRAGLDAEALEALGDVHELAAAAEDARDDLQRLRLQLEGREESVARAAAAHAQAGAAATRALDPLGIAPDGAGEVIAERLAALDTVESLRSGSVSTSGRGADVPAAIMLVAGVAAAVAGIVLGEWVTAGIGAVLVAAGVWFLLRSRAGVPALPVSDERPYLAVLGLDTGASGLELSRTRRALETARSAVAARAEAADALAQAEADATLSRDALGTRETLWESWLAAHTLDTSLTPARAASALALVAEARVAATAAVEAVGDVRRTAARLDEFAQRLADAARPFVPVPEDVTHLDVPVIANRLGERLATARAGRARIEELTAAFRAAGSQIETEETRANRARDELREILERHDLVERGTHEDLHVLRAQAEREVAEAEATFDECADTKSQLEGRLEEGARERRGGELRLAEAGLAERIADATDEYLVLAVASRLLAEAQERYERERQPEVVKHAERIFATITGGRYVGLSIPLGNGRIEAFDTRAGAKTSDQLSRGAADQLYLALRLGLIAQLGDVGCSLPVLMDDVLVNFDPQRRRGAAEAIAELAGGRQVVFFTCHPETAELFAEVAPGHTRLELSPRQL